MLKAFLLGAAILAFSWGAASAADYPPSTFESLTVGGTSGPTITKDSNGAITSSGGWSGDASNTTVTVPGSTTARTQADRAADVVNVKDLGAKGDGVTDDAPAFRVALNGSNRNVVVPPGTYLFSSTQSAVCCTFGVTSVLVQKQSNLHVTGYGATIVSSAPAFHFDEDNDFSVEGLTIQGNRTGLSSSTENTGITLTSDVDFTIRNMHFTGNYGGIGAPFVGDWLVNGTIDNIQMDSVGQCADIAYLKNFTFSNVRAHGISADGSTGIGTKCFSLIVDLPNASTNNTGVSFSDSEYVNVLNVNADNFNAGAAVSTGQNILFSGNTWHDNPGGGNAAGIGIYLYYTASGNFSSVGHPISNVTISGDRFVGNGSAVAGAGLLIDPSAIANSDAMSNISVSNSKFYNNTSSGIYLKSASSVSGLSQFGNTFSGTNQSTSVNTKFSSVATVSEVSGSVTFRGTLITTGPATFGGVVSLPNNTALNLTDGSGVGHPALFSSLLTETILRPVSSTTDVQIQNYSGSALAKFWTNSVEMVAPLTIDGNLTLAGSTVANLPTCTTALRGTLRAVTDATAPTYNGTLTGGGSVAVPVYCNGTTWTAH